MKRILILGASGVFGKRLAIHLARFEGIELILTSRTRQRADAVVQEISKHADIRAQLFPIDLDHRSGLEEALKKLSPWLVIDCSGPFQSADYTVAQAALEAGAHVMDLADSRRFILGYHNALDALARRKGLVALTGASSSPALSFSSVEAITAGWQRIDTIDIAITPGGKSPVGEAVIAAILTYCGRPVPQWKEGHLQHVPGWASSTTMTMPGLGSRRVAPVETVDAEWMSTHFCVSSRIAFHAGLESGIEQWGMIALATLRQWGVLRDLQWLSPLLLKARAGTRLTTSDRGGMIVEATGVDAQGLRTRSQWSLLAQKGDGPQVPTLPAAAMTRALLQGRLEPGARIAAGVLPLSAIEQEMQSYAITTQITSGSAPGGTVFASGLGDRRYASLSTAIRNFHDPGSYPVWQGLAEVRRGQGIVSRLAGWIIGMPPAGKDVPVIVSVERKEIVKDKKNQHLETWTRNFSGARFASHLTASERGGVTERFGPLRFDLALEVANGELHFPIRSWRAGWFPMPMFLAPVSISREYQDDEGRFCFDVCLILPIFGLLAHYKGWLKPRHSASEACKAGDDEKPVSTSL